MKILSLEPILFEHFRLKTSIASSVLLQYSFNKNIQKLWPFFYRLRPKLECLVQILAVTSRFRKGVVILEKENCDPEFVYDGHMNLSAAEMSRD